eukprot:9099305-Pyramimonas_sp.AAC.3
MLHSNKPQGRMAAAWWHLVSRALAVQNPRSWELMHVTKCDRLWPLKARKREKRLLVPGATAQLPAPPQPPSSRCERSGPVVEMRRLRTSRGISYQEGGDPEDHDGEVPVLLRGHHGHCGSQLDSTAESSAESSASGGGRAPSESCSPDGAKPDRRGSGTGARAALGTQPIQGARAQEESQHRGDRGDGPANSEDGGSVGRTETDDVAYHECGGGPECDSRASGDFVVELDGGARSGEDQGPESQDRAGPVSPTVILDDEKGWSQMRSPEQTK